MKRLSVAKVGGTRTGYVWYIHVQYLVLFDLCT